MAKQITLNGVDYKVDGVLFGSLPAWKLLTADGEPLTAASWESIPSADKQTLFQMVQQHIAELR